MPAGGKQEKTSPQGPTAMYTVTTAQNGAEYSDQELLNLVNYYEVSRVELKNVSEPMVFSFFWSDCSSSSSFSALTRCFLNQFSRPNKLIPKHRNYSKVMDWPCLRRKRQFCTTFRWLHQNAWEQSEFKVVFSRWSNYIGYCLGKKYLARRCATTECLSIIDAASSGEQLHHSFV